MEKKKGLEIIDIHKSFGKTQALDGVSFEVGLGEIVAVLGPSGCGKSTLLSIIAGLEPADQGNVLWESVSLAHVPPHKRGFGLMFQDFALFPHRNVFDNVAFALQMAHEPRQKIKDRVQEVLELVGLPGFSERDVNTLSGGEQQRVALARSLAPHPHLLMLDEPLGSLDRNLRERLEFELRDILKQMHQTAIYVTHDQEEAYVLADRIVVMNAGRVEQVGSPQEIYLDPSTEFVARFLGLNNLLPGEVRQEDGEVFIETAIGRLPAPKQSPGRVTALLRPDVVQLNGIGSCQIQGTISEASFRGSMYRVVISVKGMLLQFNFPSNVHIPAVGEQVRLGFDPNQALQIFPESTSGRDDGSDSSDM
jgi:ABC-type Fe3+/spermidine/putrescine transport system ATPase subunit